MSQESLYYILFDSQTSQVEQQALTGTRLNTLFGALTSVFGVPGSGGAWPGAAQSPLQFTPVQSGPTYGPITSGQLADARVLAILTRWNDQTGGSAPYSPQELATIQQWVSGGGGLLLMTDHPNFCENDAALASTLGFSLLQTFISNPDEMMWMSGSDFYPAPSGMESVSQIFSGVTSIVAHDGCGISYNTSAPSGVTYAPLVAFPADAAAPSGQYFAACAQYYQGRVVVVANSGIMCDIGNQVPAPGLAGFGNNLFFVLNACSWLAGIPAWSPHRGGPPNGG